MSKETVALTVNGLVAIALWGLGMVVPSMVIDILKAVWAVAQPFVLIWLYKLLKLELMALRVQNEQLQAQLRGLKK